MTCLLLGSYDRESYFVCVCVFRLIFKKIYFYFMCMGVGPACMPVHLTRLPGVYGSQKRALDSLEVELKMVESHHVGTES